MTITTTPTPAPAAMSETTPDTLARICADTLAEVARRKAILPADEMRHRARDAPPPRGFGQALMEAAAAGRIALIAEIKKASPSGGLIRPDFDPATLARAYASGGATCLSVLTDGPHFQGAPEHLRAARAAVKLPVLRKDFILDPWQVYESRAMGADCILLIMAALSDEQAVALEQLARTLDLDVLVEVHDADELRRALGLQTKLIGINNRNLKTLQTDLATTMELAPHVPPDRFLIGESGIRDNGDIGRLGSMGLACFLVGESLMRQPDVTLATRRLLGTAAPDGLEAG
jgi:indole-3-glycerol phosphate synthase